MRKNYIILIAFLCAITFTSFAQGTWQAITVENYNFELPDDGQKYKWIDSSEVDIVPGWDIEWVGDETIDRAGRDISTEHGKEGVGHLYGGTGTDKSGLFDRVFQVTGEQIPATEVTYKLELMAGCTFQAPDLDPGKLFVILSASDDADGTTRVDLDSITVELKRASKDTLSYFSLETTIPAGTQTDKYLAIEFALSDDTPIKTWFGADSIILSKEKAANILMTNYTNANMFVYNSALNIQLPNEVYTTVSLYDLTGKNIFSDTFNKNYTRQLKVTTGIYIIKLENYLGTEVKKVTIH